MPLYRDKKLKAFNDKTHSIGESAPVYFYPWFSHRTGDISSVTIDGTMSVDELRAVIKIIEEVDKL